MIKIKSVQEWIGIEKIYEDGIIKLKNKYIKIIKVTPINYNLKSELEKEAILNSYKQFLKSCNFDIQILIQSSKEDLSDHIEKVRARNAKGRDKYFSYLAQNYIEYIESFSQKNKSATKNFFIVIANNVQSKEATESSYTIQRDELQEKYFKIKNGLLRIGNNVKEENTREEIIKILKKYFYVNNE